MNGCISVIIPVYNVEKYLPQCMESVLGQTYRDLEIILIDDGSTDSSGSLCDSYAKRDSRVRVIHQANGGAAAAKNAGLDAATGEYLAFVDSDDFLEPNAYETMLRVLTEEKADVVQCAFWLTYQSAEKTGAPLGIASVYSAQEYLLRFLTDWTSSLIWNKLYDRKTLGDLRFETGHRIDDEFFTYQVIMNAGKIVYSPVALYHYRQRRSSAMNSLAAGEQLLQDRLSYLPARREKIGQRFPEIKVPFDRAYLDSLLFLARDPAATENTVKQIKKMVKTYMNAGDRSAIGIGMWYDIIRFLTKPISAILSEQRKSPNEDRVEEYYE